MLTIEIEKKLHGSKGEMKLLVNTTVKQGEFIALMGESGAGKTTLIRVLAGLEKAKGSITVDGVSWDDMPPQKREIGFVFQDYALFEHMSVEENLLFVKKDKLLAQKLLEITELTALKKRNIQTLSGGQKQRVGLCRAMMNKPKLLLMDEPFSALDAAMQTKLQSEIKQLHQTFGTTTIMVSHNISEVYALASRIWIMEQGKIVEDTPSKLLAHKKNRYSVKVLKIASTSNQLTATVSFAEELLEVEVEDGVKVGDTLEITLHPQMI